MSNNIPDNDFDFTPDKNNNLRSLDSWMPPQPSDETRESKSLPDTGSGTDPLINAHLGNLVIRSYIGGGGFGRVYLARDEKLGREVAVKLLRDPLDQQHLKLFEREAKAIAALSKHPSIVQIFEWGEYKEHAYFALEYVASSALALLDEFPEGLPVTKAVQMALEAAEGLAYAHKQGILHRDIKPGNILIDPENGKAKLVDFGLAMLDNPDSTHTSTISGSPSYMSPEQAAGQRVDARSDVFSLGVTLYQLLSNQKPFKGDGPGEVMANIQKGNKTPLREYRPDLPEGIIEVVERAMAHAPSDRFQSAEELATRLRLILRSLGRSGTVPTTETAIRVPRKRMSSLAMAAAAVVVVIALAFSLGRLLHYASPVGSPSVAMAAAKEKMNSGNFPEAEKAFAQAAQEQPGNDEASYGLGFARTQLGKLDEAQAAFEKTKASGLKTEGKAAIAFHKDREKAREELETARAEKASPYVDVMLAQLDMAGKKDKEVVSRLKDLQSDRFHYTWQYTEALQLLGQAYYHLGELDKAKQTFTNLQQVALPEQATVTTAYLRLVSDDLDGKRRKEAAATASRIRERLDAGYQAPAIEDPWTSRPLTFFVLPTQASESSLAIEKGLLDVFSHLLGDFLDTETPMKLVDREIINELLAEQNLSAQLGSQAGRLALGQVLGARIAVQCRIGKLRKDMPEELFLTIDDTETTKRLPAQSVKLMTNSDPNTIVKETAARIWEAASQAYPLRGRIYKKDGAVFANIGKNVGLKEGTMFDILRDPELDPIPDAVALVKSDVGTATAKILADGFDGGQLPESPAEGWYIRERPRAS